MDEKLLSLKLEAQKRIDESQDSKDLDKVRVEFLGKKGEFAALMKELANVPAEKKPELGKVINEARQQVEKALNQALTKIKEEEYSQKLKSEKIDITLPGDKKTLGNLHPITQVSMEIQDILIGMGFEVKEGPEIEWNRNNFEFLNIPEGHPARDMQDSFYIDDTKVLRTHTSPVQVRVMQSTKPPIRMIAPGRVYRADDVDATHSPIFNQIEGLVIDKGITMADLKGVLNTFAKAVFGEKVKIRLRPSYFPFTEPSVEVDVTCAMCFGKGCNVCKHTGWIEILGAGMVHPDVLTMSGINPEIYSGFAFGFGIDRIANIKYSISDIRLMYENDLRFLSQF